MTGLTGGGVVLSASLLLLLRARRRSQFRNRRPGRTIAVPEPQLTPVEKTISAVGDFSAPSITFLDAALRRLAASQTAAQQAMPPVTAIQLSSTAIRLHLSRPFDLPLPGRTPTTGAAGWCRSTSTWTGWDPTWPTNRRPTRCWSPSAPMTTTRSGFELGGTGRREHHGRPHLRADFARYLAAELACNPWSDAVTLDCVGIAGEVAALNPDRVRTHPAGTDPAAELIADAVATLGRGDEVEHGVATARAQQLGADSWPARLLMIDITDPPPGSLRN